MRVLQVILPIYFSLYNVSNALAQDMESLDFSEISIFHGSKGTKAPKAPKGTKAPKAPKGTKAPKAPKATNKPTVKATGKPTGKPTAAPTLPPCAGSDFFAIFGAPKQNPGDKSIKGSLKGVYLDGNKVNLKLNINFRDRTFNKVKLNDGDLLDWSINEIWDNPYIEGWNNKCRPGRTGGHHDRSVACSPDSDNAKGGFCTKPNGSKVSVFNYDCKPKDAKNTCERGDLSGKLGPLVVQTTVNGFPRVQFKGSDNFFLKRRDAEAAADAEDPYSIVISKNGEPFLCAEFIFICENLPAKENKSHKPVTNKPSKKTNKPSKKTNKPTKKTKAPVKKTTAPVKKTTAPK